MSPATSRSIPPSHESPDGFNPHVPQTGHMYEMLSDLERPDGSAETRVFQSIDEAIEWFGSEP